MPMPFCLCPFCSDFPRIEIAVKVEGLYDDDDCDTCSTANGTYICRGSCVFTTPFGPFGIDTPGDFAPFIGRPSCYWLFSSVSGFCVGDGCGQVNLDVSVVRDADGNTLIAASLGQGTGCRNVWAWHIYGEKPECKAENLVLDNIESTSGGSGYCDLSLVAITLNPT